MAASEAEMVESRLSRVRIVLINTTHPGNIGAAARAMKVMGLSSLHLVTPKIFPNAEATAMASGADDLLQSAVVHEPCWTPRQQLNSFVKSNQRAGAIIKVTE